jgi:HlyD family secretion protein
VPIGRSLARRPWLVVLLAVAAGGGAYAVVRARGPAVPVARVARHDLEHHLVASGRVMAPARIEMAALTTGLVVAVNVREGAHVKPGDVLVQLDDAEANAAVAKAEAAVAQARARADQIKSVASVVAGRTLAEAQANLDNAEQQFERTRALVASGSLAQQELEGAHRALDVARAQRDAAMAQQAGSSAAGVDARAAWAAFSQTQAQLTSAKVRLAQTRVVAAQDATVLTRDVEKGDVVPAAHTLLTLSAAGDTRLVLQPDERDLAFIRLGQKARASADAFPDDVFDAEVDYIAPSIDVARGTVEVRLRVPAPPAYLRPDMTTSVDMTVAAKRAAVVAPFESIRGLATPRPWALAVVDGRAARRDLKLGIRGEGSVEILAGLAEGDAVVLPDGQTVSAGQRVRAAFKDP